MRKTFQAILIIVFLVGIIAYLSITAISDLANTEDVHTIRVDGAYEALSVEHSINGLIPVGTDHYYIGVDLETSEAYLIHASPSWFSGNFDDEGYSKAPEGIEITSLVKKISDYELSKELSSHSSSLSWATFTYGVTGCFELSYQLIALLKLLLVVLIVPLALVGRYIVTHRGTVNKAVSIGYAVLLLAAVVLVFIVVR